MAAEVSDYLFFPLVLVLFAPFVWHDVKLARSGKPWGYGIHVSKLHRPGGLEWTALSVGLAVTGGTLWFTR